MYLYQVILISLSLVLIPEPGILMYGTIRDDSCKIQEGTIMKATYFPSMGGDTLSISTPLRRNGEGSNLYTYRLLIPLSTYIPGVRPRTGSIKVGAAKAPFQQEFRIGSSSLTKVETVYFSQRDRGTFRMYSFVW